MYYMYRSYMYMYGLPVLASYTSPSKPTSRSLAHSSSFSAILTMVLREICCACGRPTRAICQKNETKWCCKDED